MRQQFIARGRDLNRSTENVKRRQKLIKQQTIKVSAVVISRILLNVQGWITKQRQILF